MRDPSYGNRRRHLRNVHNPPQGRGGWELRTSIPLFTFQEGGSDVQCLRQTLPISDPEARAVKANQSPLDDTFSDHRDARRAFDPYLVEIDAERIYGLVYCRHTTAFSKLWARKRCACPGGIHVKPYIRIIAHLGKQTQSDLKPVTNHLHSRVSAISSILSIAPLDVVPTVPTGVEI